MKIGRMAKLGEVFNLNHDIESHRQSVSLLNPLHPVPKIRMKNLTCHEIQEEKAGSTDEGSDEEHWQLESNSSEIKFDNTKCSRTHVRDYNLMAASQVFFFPALGGLLFGYDIGATSAVVSQLESIYSGVKWSSAVVNSSSLQGIITAMSTLGALIGSIACFRLADLLGRKKSLLIASFLYLCGAALEIISGDPNWNAASGIAVLLLGRLVYGFGIGFAMNGAPAYIGEMAPSAIRGISSFFLLIYFNSQGTISLLIIKQNSGILLSLKEVFIVFGITLGYTFGYIYSSNVGGWRYTYALSIPFAVVMFLGMHRLPYSARWLALKGRMSEAKSSLQFVNPDLSEGEIEAIREVAEKAANETNKTSFADDYRRLTSPTIFPAMVAGVGLVFFQQVTGQPSVLYYADSLFKDVGLSSYSSILVSLFKLVATLVAAFTVDKQGRKLLLYIGCSLMLIALLMLGSAFLVPYSSKAVCNTYVTDDTCTSSCLWDTATCGLSTCVAAGKWLR